MKTLFEFELLKQVEQEETTITKEGDSEVKTTKTVLKEIPLKVAIKKPTRDLIDDGKLFYAVKSSEAHQAGVISEVLLRKRLMNDGGALSEQEKAEYGETYLSFFEKQKAYHFLESKNFNDLTDQEKEQKAQIQIDISNLTQKISAFESSNSQIFENTVEAFARSQSMRWWILNLSYIQKLDENNIPKANEFVPLFGAGDYKVKLKNYDLLEETAEEFYLTMIRKLANLISYWYINQANTPEDFKNLSDSYDSELKANVKAETKA